VRSSEFKIQKAKFKKGRVGSERERSMKAGGSGGGNRFLHLSF
jgi:hypothetical protein